MRKFEIGKRYFERESLQYEIVARTAKTVKYVEVQHAGRFNEKKSETKSKKIINWDDREVFFTNTDTVEA